MADTDTSDPKNKTEGSGDKTDTLISKLDFGHPLYLHPSDITSTPIVTQKLTGTENYRVWCCAMSLALRTKNKFGFVDGTCLKETYRSDPILLNQWERCNSVVLSWILNSISENLYSGQVFSEIAQEVWDELKETYDKVDGSVVFNLHQKINSLTQKGSSLSDYYHKLNSLWKQYDAMVNMPKCTCAVKCTCEASKEIQDHRHLMKLMQFLMGLDDLYQPVRSQILMTEPLPTLQTAFAILSREESHRNSSGTSVTKTQATSFSSKSNNNSVSSNANFKAYRGPNPNLKCTKCNKIGHTIEKCWEIVGYPPKKNQGVSTNKTGSNSSSWTANKSFVNNNSNSDSQSSLPITEEQMIQLLAFLNRRNTTDDPKSNMAGFTSKGSNGTNPDDWE